MTTNMNEQDKTKTKLSKLYDPDANPLWLSIATYDDPKHHVIRRVFVNKINACTPRGLRDSEKRKDYRPIKNEVYELDFHLGDLKFVYEDDMTPPTEEQIKRISVLTKELNKSEQFLMTMKQADTLISQYEEFLEQRKLESQQEQEPETEEDD